MKISIKWGLVLLYTIGIFTLTPYLPRLIRLASSRWSSPGVSHFVLGVEIIIALGILILAIGLLIYGKKKAIFFLLSIGCIFLLSLIIYQYLPNPYEFTHLPEYAVLSFLIMWALDKEKRAYKARDLARNDIICRDGEDNIGKSIEKDTKFGIIKNSYFLSGSITGVIGIIDEIYQYFLPSRFLTIYDIFLNILGGILGLLVFWGTKR